MISTLFLILCIVLLSNYAEACNKRRNPPPPPPPPPPGTPPPPPPPPPILKVVREREQVMTRNNCKRVEVDTHSSNTLEEFGSYGSNGEVYEQYESALETLENEGQSDQCVGYEAHEYSCQFTVYSEIAMTVIYHPTGCGCAFTVSVVTPRVRDDTVSNLVNVQAAYDTSVISFNIVIFNWESNQVEEVFEEFGDMVFDEAVKDTIEAQVAADPNGDFSKITAGFAGTVKSFPVLPDKLNKNDPANKHYIPAICFTIEQKYSSGAMFNVPCDLKMHTAPNAYTSLCSPHRMNDNAAAKRNVDAADDVAWVKSFYLFPKQDAECGVSGYTPKSRFIRAIYASNDCKPTSGYFSIDTEFQSKFSGSDALVGAWKWEREFDEQRIVFGVPNKFSDLRSVWCLGYSQISWISNTNFQATDLPVTNGICSSLPVSNNQANSNWVAESQEFKYKESHPSYPIIDGVDCAPLQLTCERDVTLLAFQNDDPRDFAKHSTSTMVTGPQTKYCQNFAQDDREVVEFDTIVYRGVLPNDSLEKRSVRTDFPAPAQMHMVIDPDTGLMRHGRHAAHLVRAYNEDARKRGEQVMHSDPVGGAPHRENVGMQTAAGSVDTKGENGAGAGDHPLRLFPETYTAPLTLDPAQQNTEPLVYDGELVDGLPPKLCDIGDVGCKCRDDSSCDFPFVCGGLGYCQHKPCPPGEAGCEVHSDGGCEKTGVDGAPLVARDGYCVYATAPACDGANAGSVGCACDDKTPCGDGITCTDNFCTKPTAEAQFCSAGEAGCECATGECSNGAQCHPFSGLCVFVNCVRGTPGCQVATEGVPCSAGFVASNDYCVEASCLPGTAGCKCDGSACSEKTHRCLNLDRTGSRNMCVGIDLCTEPDHDRCARECGSPSNVAVCPKCSYSTPICKDERLQICNPKSYLYGIEKCELDGFTDQDPDNRDEGAAAAVVVSVFSVAIAFAALF